MKSKLVSLSAISSALTALSLTIGAYVEIADLSALVLSSIFIIMPLYYNSYKASFLTSFVGVIIAFLSSGFNIMSLVFPSYVVFFGVYPILRFFMSEKIKNKWLIYIIGSIWFILTVYGMYFYYTTVMGVLINDLPLWLLNNILYWIAPLALIIYIVYDKFIMVSKGVLDRYIGRIIKR